MENPESYAEELTLLRLHDNAKTFTNYIGMPTPPSTLNDALINIFEVIDNDQTFGDFKFQLRTLYFRYLLGKPYTAMGEDDYSRTCLSCLQFILKLKANFPALERLSFLISDTEYQGYFITQQHIDIQIELMGLSGNLVDITTPYQFSSVVLSKEFRNSVNRVIDLALTLTEMSNKSAEEIFLGSCKFVSEKNNVPIVNSIQSNFEHALIPAEEVKTSLRLIFESITTELS